MITGCTPLKLPNIFSRSLDEPIKKLIIYWYCDYNQIGKHVLHSPTIFLNVLNNDIPHYGINQKNYTRNVIEAFYITVFILPVSVSLLWIPLPNPIVLRTRTARIKVSIWAKPRSYRRSTWPANFLVLRNQQLYLSTRQLNFTFKNMEDIYIY